MAYQSVQVQVDCSSWGVNGEWASLVRRCVFVQEQGIDECEEWDEHDVLCVHALAWWNGKPIATGRLLPDGKIGRMAVLAPFRRCGVGTAVLMALLLVAREKGLMHVHLSAQEKAISFYEKHGFAVHGKPHVEVGIAHQWMRLELHQTTLNG